jgi:hypothetical protein
MKREKSVELFVFALRRGVDAEYVYDGALVEA